MENIDNNDNKRKLWKSFVTDVKTYLMCKFQDKDVPKDEISGYQDKISGYQDQYNQPFLSTLDDEKVKLLPKPIDFLDTVIEKIKAKPHTSKETSKDDFVDYLARMIVSLLWLWSANIIIPSQGGSETSYPCNMNDCLQMIQKALDYCELSHKNRKLVTVINGLMQNWDIALSQRHDYAPIHCIILMSGNDESCMPTPKDGKDIHLTVVQLNAANRTKRQIMIALHELGHCVGCRQRVARAPSFLSLAAMSYCDCVYRKAWAKILHTPNEAFIPNRALGTYYSTGFRQKMTESKLMMEKIETKLENSLKDIQLTDLTIPELYLHSLSNQVKQVIEKKINDNEIVSVLSECSVSVKDAFTEAMTEVLTDAEKNQDNKIETWDFISRVILLYEEIAADVFMIRTLGMKSAGKYLRVILDQAKENYKDQDHNEVIDESLLKRSFWQVALSDVLRIRICAILYVLLDGRKSEILPWLMFSKERRETCRKLLIQYQAYLTVDHDIDIEQSPTNKFYYTFIQQDLWNPIRFFAAYATNIHQDQLYDSVCGKWTLQNTKRNNWDGQNREGTAKDYVKKDIKKHVTQIRSCYSFLHRCLHINH